jgi:hypothetical protein
MDKGAKVLQILPLACVGVIGLLIALYFLPVAVAAISERWRRYKRRRARSRGY